MKRPLIGLAISAGLFLLSLGLCGYGGTSENGGTSSTFLFAGLVALGLSLAGGACCLVWLIVALVRGAKN